MGKPKSDNKGTESRASAIAGSLSKFLFRMYPNDTIPTMGYSILILCAAFHAQEYLVHKLTPKQAREAFEKVLEKLREEFDREYQEL